MEVAWKWMLQRSGAGSVPASCAPAGSQASRTPAIGKRSARFTNMDSHRGGPAVPLLIVTGKCLKPMTGQAGRYRGSWLLAASALTASKRLTVRTVRLLQCLRGDGSEIGR